MLLFQPVFLSMVESHADHSYPVLCLLLFPGTLFRAEKSHHQEQGFFLRLAILKPGQIFTMAVPENPLIFLYRFLAFFPYVLIDHLPVNTFLNDH